jgi:hypothetical protein
MSWKSKTWCGSLICKDKENCEYAYNKAEKLKNTENELVMFYTGYQCLKIKLKERQEK